MRVSELGEFGLISRLADLIDKKSNKKAGAWKDLLIGIGDDTAAWKPRSKVELITTDVMVEEIHFDFSYTGWGDLGWKSIAINVSDIYAMGGTPQYALVSLALPGSHKVGDVLNMYDGMMEICNTYGIALAGGNISASEKVIVNVTLTGTAGNQIMTRSDARIGDLIAIFGHPGLSAAGLKSLKDLMDMPAPALKKFRTAHLRPAPRPNSGLKLASCGVKAAIDTSDGLLSDLGHICEASGVNAVIYQQNLPVHPLLKRYFRQDYPGLVLTGGEDYELLFTANEDVMDTVINSVRPSPTIIGAISAGRPGNITVLDARGKPVRLGRRGWDHYKKRAKNG